MKVIHDIGYSLLIESTNGGADWHRRVSLTQAGSPHAASGEENCLMLVLANGNTTRIPPTLYDCEVLHEIRSPRGENTAIGIRKPGDKIRHAPNEMEIKYNELIT